MCLLWPEMNLALLPFVGVRGIRFLNPDMQKEIRRCSDNLPGRGIGLAYCLLSLCFHPVSSCLTPRPQNIEVENR
jgi:hypothetical protein